jgi:hypothetical protein
MPFLRRSGAAILLLLLVLPAAAVRAAGDRRAAVDQALLGPWAGALEYKDYQHPERRVTLPTTLMVARAKGEPSLVLRWVYDDGPGKLLTQTDRFVLTAAGDTLEWGAAADSIPARYAVRVFETRDEGRHLRMLLETEGSDDDAPATIRETITASARELRILREVRPAAAGAGASFGFRHEYVFRR